MGFDRRLTVRLRRELNELLEGHEDLGAPLVELLQRFHDEGLLSGGPVLSSCRCHDRASQEQIQLLHTILEQMAEGVLVADSEGRFTFFNQQAERLLGSRPDLPPDQWSGHYGTHQLEERGELQPVPAHRVPPVPGAPRRTDRQRRVLPVPDRDLAQHQLAASDGHRRPAAGSGLGVP